MTKHPSLISDYGGVSHAKKDRLEECSYNMIACAIAISITLNALGICAIRLAKAYAIIKKANHKD